MIRSLLILFLAVPAFAATPDEIRIAMAMERERHKHPESKVVIPVPEPTANIFADYPDAKLRAALQPPAQPQPVARAVRPNVGNCPCGQGRCICSPASICPNGCPAVANLRKDEVKYYFPAFDPNCPTGR